MQFSFWSVVTLVGFGFLAGYYCAKSTVFEECYNDAERSIRKSYNKIASRIDDLAYDVRHS